MGNLGRVTLGTLGFASYFEDPTRLPPIDNTTKNKLVQLGSGNSTPDLSRVASSCGSSSKLPTKQQQLPDYPEPAHDKSSFEKMFQAAKKSKDFR